MTARANPLVKYVKADGTFTDEGLKYLRLLEADAAASVGGGGSSAWGDITGTLSAQTDLQAALNGKQNTGSYLADAPSDGTQYARINGAWGAISAGEYSLCKAKGNTGGASLDDVEAAISWAAPVISSADISVSGSVVTINNNGTYKFTVALRTDNGNRTELFIRTYINTGGGLTQDTDETVSDYVSRDGDQDTGSVVLVTALALSAGNTVEFRGFGDTDGTCVMLDAGTRLLVEKVA